jgi:hypothetical protein
MDEGNGGGRWKMRRETYGHGFKRDMLGMDISGGIS